MASKQGRCEGHQREPWASSKNKSRHERGYDSAWDKRRKRILKRDNYLCQPCKEEGIYTKAKAVDHKKPKSQGGGDEDENLQSICDPCHKEKTIKERNHNGRQ